ncbi:uncharacterized protein C8A04DRAFT_11343 [Dichotomopilus funicola]|uniref:Uncharacterized protein n=1 Tax=Dichotomopilus funicola TaxID=1934379 RepID=A0AAN6V550_9PEZI|nr:hypothetical protein C8A04DRAFT_11343 [Dichotomopilus funicola]
MNLRTSNPGISVEDEDWVYIANGSGRSTPRLQTPGKDRLRRSPQASKVWRTKRVTSTGRIERQSRKARSSINRREDEAFTAIVAAAMISYNPFRKPLASPDGRFAKYILMPTRHQETTDIDDSDDLVPMDHCPESPIESLLPRDREDPCSFRTRLMDSLVDPEVVDVNVEAEAKAKAGTRLAFESTDLLESEDVNFDDSQCISVGRTKNKLGAIFPTSVNSIVRQEISDKVNNDDDNDGDDASSPMEEMNMPFWTLPPRQKKQRVHYNRRSSDSVDNNDEDDEGGDDMSIITDISLIPTYFPSDVMRQQSHTHPYTYNNNSNNNHHQRTLSDRTHQHRALLKRVLRGHTSAAKQTMRRLKRSCRDAVESVFVRHHGDANNSNNLSTATTMGVGLMGRGCPWAPTSTRCVAVAVGAV